MDDGDAFDEKVVSATGEVEVLIEECVEIQQLIEEWQPATDADTQWAIYLLKKCLKRRKVALLRCVH